MALLDDLRAAYPWPTNLPGRDAPLERVWEFELAVPPDRLWPVVADTSRTNRAIGLSAMQFEEKNGVLHGETLNAGVLQKWVEVPWDWVEGRALMGMRLYSEGFAYAVRALYALEPSGKGTRLSVYFGWLPRSPAWRMFLALGAVWLKRRYGEVLAEAERSLAAAAPPPYLTAAAPALAPERKARLDALAKEAAARASPLAVEKLRAHIEGGDDIDLFRIRPRLLARRFDVPERDLILACLVGTRTGLLTLTWDLICPHCRGVRESPRDLRDVPQRAHCDVCDVEFGADEENAVEVSFHVHPSIREVPPVFFCSAEPAQKKHILLQQRVEPGERRLLNVALPVGRLRARSSAGAPVVLDVSADVSVDGGADGSAALSWRSRDPGPLVCGTNTALTLDNDGTETTTFVVEDARWADDALRPHDLFVMPEFKDLFSEQSLGVGVRVSVGEQTILFTDMVGSTWFYENRGDAEAFAEVKKHFAEVFAEIDAAHGCVVKTVGDAVMAAFASPLDALRAARGIQQRFPKARADTSVRLRISVCRGPCLAVSLNTGVDFFGRTVNLSAKLQALADAHEIAFPKELLEHPGVRELVVGGAPPREVTLENKAYAAPIPSVVWSVGKD